MSGWETAFACVLLLGSSVSPAFAFREPTHELINTEAANSLPELARVLRSAGLSQGLVTVLTDRNVRRLRVIQWIARGGSQEDSPDCRAARHFHNPLYQADGSGIAPWNGTWAEAGLQTGNLVIAFPCLGFSFASAIRWAQDGNQSVGAQAAWQVARDAYRVALTDPNPTNRERAFADTFLIVGQQMHLVEDASVPEHVRNDPHPYEYFCPRGPGMIDFVPDPDDGRWHYYFK